jgi:serine/threonine protein kinase
MTNMSDTGTNIGSACTRCGAPLAPRSTERLCPACLLRATLTDDDTVPPPPVDCPGCTLLEEIGRGGMGSVWRALHRESGDTVAIKILVGGPLSSPDARRCFLREAEITRRLDHPGIVRVRELSEADGHLFLVMDYVEGETLAQRLRGEPTPARQVATWLRELADAVAHAHERGVVHRDLKPGNILLDLEGVSRIVDFGLAALIDRPGEASVSSSGLGTVSYLAPEQAAGRRDLIGPTTDIHGLGAVLFHCLTGRPPFVGDNVPRPICSPSLLKRRFS